MTVEERESVEQLWSHLVVEEVMAEGGRGELIWPKGKRGESVG